LLTAALLTAALLATTLFFTLALLTFALLSLFILLLAALLSRGRDVPGSFGGLCCVSMMPFFVIELAVWVRSHFAT